MNPDFKNIYPIEKTLEVSVGTVNSINIPNSRITHIPDDELLDLNETTFLDVIKKLGGVNVTTSQMLKFFKIIHAEGRRYGKLRDMMKKLSKRENPPLRYVFDEERREYKITLIQ
jgi:hypothetical protein